MSDCSWYFTSGFFIGFLSSFIMYKMNLKDLRNEMTHLQNQIDHFKAINESDLNS